MSVSTLHWVIITHHIHSALLHLPLFASCQCFRGAEPLRRVHVDLWLPDLLLRVLATTHGANKKAAKRPLTWGYRI